MSYNNNVKKVRRKKEMKDITKDLENLGLLRVKKIGDNSYIMRTKNNHLMCCYYSYIECFEQEVWSLETYNNSTINCYLEIDDLLGAIRNYIK